MKKYFVSKTEIKTSYIYVNDDNKIDGVEGKVWMESIVIESKYNGFNVERFEDWVSSDSIKTGIENEGWKKVDKKDWYTIKGKVDYMQEFLSNL